MIKQKSMKSLFCVGLLFCTHAYARNAFEVTALGCSEFEIRTTIPNHTYPDASILVSPLSARIANSSRYGVSPSGGYLFHVSETAPANFSIPGFNGSILMRLCLTGRGSEAISCQRTGLLSVSSQDVATANITANATNTAIPLAYTSQSKGQAWSQPISMPTTIGSTSLDQVHLIALACSSDGLNCVAGGYFIEDASSPTDTTAFVYRSTDGGSTWSEPRPLAAPDVTYATSLTQVTGMFCSGDGSRCVAVGQSTFQVTESQQNTRAIAYTSNDGGVTWTGAAVLDKPDSYFTNVVFNLSCDSTGTRCTSVGYGQENANEWLPIAYHSADGGLTWSGPVELPLEPDTYSILYGVGCSNTNQTCNAVGYVQSGSGSQPTVPVVYQTTTGGMSTDAWTQITLDTATSTETSRLSAISCGRTGMYCTAVGNASNNAGLSSGLIYFTHDGGTTWSQPISPTPPDNTANNTLNAVNCSVTGNICVTVGSGDETPGKKVFVPYSYTSTDGGESWSSPVLIPTTSTANRADGSNMSGVSGSG